jgi:CubicO group peptidase (beta-lactamase class C family)
VLLGKVVERVTSQPIRAYIDEHILESEGLIHTTFPVGAELPTPHPHGYWRTPEGEIVDTSGWNTSWGGAAGQMVSTLDDLRIWAYALATGILLTPASQEQREQFLTAQEMTLVVLLNSSVDVLDSVAVMQAITRVISPDNIWPNPPASPVTATPTA